MSVPLINRRVFVAWAGAVSTFLLAGWTHGNPGGGNFLTDNSGTILLLDNVGNPLLAA